ncbi:acetylxylan esterase [Luteimonas yindakuii]|uniref:Acetylxylan esterase n=1 Tax=Luteimonas yindakuii TaxID=2565782 RepID=A0A4Z1R3T7_9GAMM|nr:alpha/beta hydrolase [Luteimonas yindakuii]QCO66713.2 acetylxylan esterase [Luteimonas yindakuii]TKS53205.1 acetylxylan esterase [Luteimonas yindakuii]
MRHARRVVPLLLLVALLGGCGRDDAAAADAPLPPELACQAGAWRLPDGQAMALTPATGGMRYRTMDGRSGLFAVADRGPDGTYRARTGWRAQGGFDARAVFDDCAAGRLDFRHAQGPDGEARRLALDIRETRFASGDLDLQGRLLMPAGARAPLPLAVLVHGSEPYSAIVHQPLQYLLPAQGIAVFVYDKRGTGGSTGRYSQDFHALAGDAVAALAEARRLAPGAFAHAGFVGGSQGGWIGPLAASRSDADYVVALYGLADGALAEDREQVLDGLRARGHGDDVLAQAREVTDATGQLMASGFTRGFDALRDVRRRYGDVPWFAELEGEFTGELVRIPGWLPHWLVRRIAMRRDVATSWDYEPLPVLEALRIPQLWVIAAQDEEAPNAETLRRIAHLQRRGQPVDLALFPRTDHGILEFEEVDGERTPLRHPPGYFPLLAEWIAGTAVDASADHGTATITPRSGATQVDQARNGLQPAPHPRPVGEIGIAEQ